MKFYTQYPKNSVFHSELTRLLETAMDAYLHRL